MTLKLLMHSMLPAVEAELQRVVSRLDEPPTRPFHEMLSYHMGWSGIGAGPNATGKRVRPLLLLLTSAACDSNWQLALPAAVCVELIHNFSLAHDDIQDGSEMRRGRISIWKKWGVAQAINVGDVLFILAHLALLEIKDDFPPEIAFKAGAIVHEACLALSSGQFLDIAYEKQADLTAQDYWPMISGKTAALLSACTQVGALLGGADEPAQENYRKFGHYLGLAFQVQDDYLSIWGDSAMLGKSTESDLVTGKKTLPVIYGLSKNGQFARRWSEGPIINAEVGQWSDQLAREGAKSNTQQTVDQMTDLALQFLHAAGPRGMAGDALFDFAKTLLDRQT